MGSLHAHGQRHLPLPLIMTTTIAVTHDIGPPPLHRQHSSTQFCLFHAIQITRTASLEFTASDRMIWLLMIPFDTHSSFDASTRMHGYTGGRRISARLRQQRHAVNCRYRARGLLYEGMRPMIRRERLMLIWKKARHVSKATK